MTEDLSSDSSVSSDEQEQSSAPEVQRRTSPPPGVTWLDQDEQLRTLWTEKKSPEEISAVLGRSVAAIMTRAARLGLPRRAAPGRKRGYKRTDAPKRKAKSSAPRIRVRAAVHDNAEEEAKAKAQIKTRVCLMCLNKFESMGAFNRICPSCKGSADYVKGSSTPDFTYNTVG